MKINTIDKNGIIKEYDTIMTFHSDDYNKDYVVYTDNKYNDNDELQIFFNEYDPNELECIVKNIEDKKEYNRIKTIVNEILLTIKNENDKII